MSTSHFVRISEGTLHATLKPARTSSCGPVIFWLLLCTRECVLTIAQCSVTGKLARALKFYRHLDAPHSPSPAPFYFLFCLCAYLCCFIVSYFLRLFCSWRYSCKADIFSHD